MYPDGGLRVRTVQHHVLVGPTSERQSDMYHKSLHSVEFEERYTTVHLRNGSLTYICSFVN